ncbi:MULTISPECIES: DNA replication/repair protein RecF [Halomonadaceae]|uniref:DNA replication/repair protein RecF n=1 Tax=Halomonadaceae TaxID=28256 RepID=UPI00038D19FA|nr:MULTISPECIES: DNA replication/repair protein RecF [Halomonas]NAO98287.1 DNA replication/repair protein RecF [Halomonas sp. MG34]QGQ68960.1 DNA replication/repair protein RecF [Halomonas sp. PA16-9]UEQ04288.1 DNA replication/repair protein RecF [Halomonas profundus]MCD1585969.1 DNA replication/repair protein RecF [Halomonas sp. IOP_14]PKH58365.1 DNA replication and repair protein RecF [Halomonas sp. Choline-3u-9]|tara:strand:+ start:3529 stop:4632 length:1104 start_codon:yes stop_codon:yes gene_type:complete
MSLTLLNFHALRNLRPVEMTPSSHINVISGANGSGKTSLLEGVHILGMGRSFRTRQLKNAIQTDEPYMTLYGRLSGEPEVTLGVRRLRAQRELELRLKGDKNARLAELVEAMPLQLINPDAFRLLEGSPAGRREFLDWGVFHVKHDFLAIWKRTRRALKHRNALLRRGRILPQEMAVWEHELALWGEQMDSLRRAWFSDFLPVFEETLKVLLPLPGLSLHYARGWDKDRTLATVLHDSRPTDQQMGFTQQGPQRADLRIRINKQPAVEVLSRGQQKLVVSALKLAQGRFLERTAQRHCIYLIDDLPAELDEQNRYQFCGLLEDMQCQAFITSVEPSALKNAWRTDTPVNMFHVKHCKEGFSGLEKVS